MSRVIAIPETPLPYELLLESRNNWRIRALASGEMLEIVRRIGDHPTPSDTEKLEQIERTCRSQPDQSGGSE